MIRIVSLVAALVIANPALGADEPRCNSDRDCPGAAICQDGACIGAGMPSRSSATPLEVPEADASRFPPEPPRSAESSRRSGPSSPAAPRSIAVKVHPVVPLATSVLAGMASQELGQPVAFLALPFELEHGLASAKLPNFSVLIMASPLYLSAGTTTVFGTILGVGGRFYFTGRALDGAFVGVMLSLFVGSSSPAGVLAGASDNDAQVQVGYQWVFDFGFTIGLAGTWSPVAFSTNTTGITNTYGLGFQIPIGIAF